jgi:hypothetical protein
MKKYLLIALLIFFISCDKKSIVEKEVEEIPLSLTIERFDKVFYETPISDFQQMRKKYVAFFPTQYPDSIFINKIKNPLYRELYDEVQKEYANFQPVQTEIEDVFRHIKYYFPTKK